MTLTLLLAVTAAAMWCTTLWVLRAYDSRRIGQGPEEFSMVGRAAVTMLVALVLGSYLANLVLPRGYVLVAVPVAGLATAVHRYALRRWLHAQRHDGTALLRTLVIGSPSAVDEVVRDLSTVHYHGYDVVGACVPADMTDVEIADDVTVVGTMSDVPQAVIDHEADVVIVAGSGLSNSSLRRLSWALERTGADLVVAPGLIEVAGPRVQVRPAAGLSLLHVESPERHQGRMLAKAVLDRSVGFALFLVALPIIAVSALLVRLTSKGSAFYAQSRMGRDGQPFTMWKLRSMVVDADRMRTDDLLQRSDRDGLMFKMRRDPRVTPVGRVLRRLSLDELPQLWNVVRGDMSLVGPRPPLPSEFAEYHDAVHRRLRVKPGVTGLWQVSGRSDLTWEESIRLDLRYVDNWSVALDLQILWKTARAVVKGSGAY
ncbi:sugar transferase [Angustibacter sp. Root456]|uniref:sugar transferase n=1 Tax=Angustibacter sp. Root456 TaxID=1736539 RepID=UPI000AD75CC0|nr:sugar transferase [Angustibacter sp. Root456]